MTIKILDRAFETTITTGTTAIVLQGAQAGFQSFAVAGNGAKVFYQINDGDSSGVVQKWEVGIGTVSVGSPNTLSRDAILSSSNNNQPVSFGTGPKNVLGAVVAKALPTRDENLNFIEGFGIGGGTATAHTVTMPVAPLSYSGNMRIAYYPAVANAGAFTINVDSLGAKAAKFNGVDPIAGFAQPNTMLEGFYNAVTGVVDLVAPASYIGVPLQQGGSFSQGVMMLQDQRVSGDSGQVLATGSDQQRALNTVTANTIAGASLASNQFTLTAGTYDFKAQMPGYRVDRHRAILYNVTDAALVLTGMASYSGSASGYAVTNSIISGRFTIAATKVFEVRHRCGTTGTTSFPSGYGTEVYADVEIRKVA